MIREQCKCLLLNVMAASNGPGLCDLCAARQDGEGPCLTPLAAQSEWERMVHNPKDFDRFFEKGELHIWVPTTREKWRYKRKESSEEVGRSTKQGRVSSEDLSRMCESLRESSEQAEVSKAGTLMSSDSWSFDNSTTLPLDDGPESKKPKISALLEEQPTALPLPSSSVGSFSEGVPSSCAQTALSAGSQLNLSHAPRSGQDKPVEKGGAGIDPDVSRLVRLRKFRSEMDVQAEKSQMLLQEHVKELDMMTTERSAIQTAHAAGQITDPVEKQSVHEELKAQDLSWIIVCHS